mmetsp:Transcript_50778/g.94947  ORF Transcript_50778/g.94947 Transcript_50778/m.94947 type:complete len:110 (-) Transcript_50778:26-355(-)
MAAMCSGGCGGAPGVATGWREGAALEGKDGGGGGGGGCGARAAGAALELAARWGRGGWMNQQSARVQELPKRQVPFPLPLGTPPTSMSDSANARKRVWEQKLEKTNGGS